MSKLHLELVTPEALVFSADIESVVVPGMQGDFGVLVNHAPMISSLRPGVIDICETGQSISRSFFVSQGFTEVTNESCTILARTAIDVTGKPEEAKGLLQKAEAS
jgi:F-type H+-transporting ATPase subunit epsilon